MEEKGLKMMEPKEKIGMDGRAPRKIAMSTLVFRNRKKGERETEEKSRGEKKGEDDQERKVLICMLVYREIPN